MRKKLHLALLLIMIFNYGFSQNSYWKSISKDRLEGKETFERASFPSEYKLYSLELNNLKSQLVTAPSREDLVFDSTVIMQFPNPDGTLENYKMYEASVMDSQLANKFPGIRSYIGKGIDDPTATINISTTVFGFHAMVLSGKRGTFYIDTYTKDLNNYMVYERSKVSRTNSFSCAVVDEEDMNKSINTTSAPLANGGVFRTYRLAMACTIEYAAFHVNAANLNSGTLAQKKAAVLSAMVVTMTRVNGLYERDMSLRMNLVANNDLVIFIDSDNFSNSAANSLINESQVEIDATIGFTNYDIGHTVSTGGGGLAQLNSPCTTNKARGITGSPSPVGDPFDIDYVAHEMGHQFGATHTFNNSCGGNRSGGTAVEPGSGTTIMGYAGICAPDIQGNSDAHFHAVSLAQMDTFIAGSGGCAVTVANGNTPPVVNAGVNYTIPNGTAFILKGSATDANNDSLTYCWEQTNTQVSTQPPVSTSTLGPNFRSLPPATSPDRYMPNFQQVLLGNLAPTWEVVPTVARTMAFSLTVRDNRTPNGGQTNRGNVTITTAAVGPFRITSPSVENTSWLLGSSQTITWDVAGTTANGINTANVNILISTNGGTTFTTLVANTPNDGSQTITVPNTPSTSGRIMIESVGNIFYAVSKNIAIGYTIVSACNTYSDNNPLPFVDQAPGNFTTRTINVPITGSISDVNVVNNITHTYLSDVQTDISSPQNPTTFIKLFNRGCGMTNGTVNLNFSDGAGAIDCLLGTTLQTVAPGGSLSTFNGQNPQGVWTFRVYDNFGGDVGTVNNWSIEVCTQTVTLATENFGLDGFVLYPNPNNGNFNIQFNSASTNEISIQVNDIRGRVVYDKKFQNSGIFNQNLQLSNVEAGVYLVTVLDGEKKEVKKIIIE